MEGPCIPTHSPGSCGGLGGGGVQSTHQPRGSPTGATPPVHLYPLPLAKATLKLQNLTETTPTIALTWAVFVRTARNTSGDGCVANAFVVR